MLKINPSTKVLSNDVTSNLAVSQCVAARMLLYYPGKNLRLQLAVAAFQLFHILNSLAGDDKKAFSDRLLGKEGLMPGKQIKDLSDALHSVAEDGLDSDFPARPALGHSRAVVLTLMGDIGALYTDTGATTGTVSAKPAKDKLRKNMGEILDQRGLSLASKDDLGRIAKTGGTKKVGPGKSLERGREEIWPNRSGIHDRGGVADNWMKIGKQDRIGSALWQLAVISSDLVNMSTEPIVGHMSASPSEILFCWDMLCGWESSKQYTKPNIETDKNKRLFIVNSEARHARAAGACAMLQGVGFHSSLECLEGTLFYLGQDISEYYNPWANGNTQNLPNVGYNNTRVLEGATVLDAALLFTHGAATDLICELLFDEMDQEKTAFWRGAFKIYKKNRTDLEIKLSKDK
jgi:hypothetical protein